MVAILVESMNTYTAMVFQTKHARIMRFDARYSYHKYSIYHDRLAMLASSEYYQEYMVLQNSV